jgi:hypothetical protein
METSAVLKKLGDFSSLWSYNQANQLIIRASDIYSQIQTEWTRSKVLVACSSLFTMWLVFVETSVADPGCLYRIRILSIPDPGSASKI